MLELHAMRFLRFEKRCDLVLFERSPREHICGRPDVLGVRNRWLYEVEVKRTVQDFRADMEKLSRVNREGHAASFPRQFWYMVPLRLCEKVLPLVPQWAGLITLDTRHARLMSVVKRAPVNECSRRLSVRECVRLVRLMANQIFSLAGGWRHYEPQDYEI